MTRASRLLILVSVLGLAFFWVTDPSYGLAGRWLPPARLIDTANELRIGTWVGFVGCGLVLLVGLWLATRRTT